MTTDVRLWCGKCGKACGHLTVDDQRWWYVGQFSLPRTDDSPKAKAPTRLPLAFSDDATANDDAAASVTVTCSSGHYLHLDPDEMQIELRSGVSALTLHSHG